mmetsp:Transcript_1712/g.4952  ORF Transcript_1712/g.4952 Transcript_1712/m.4952 type:complete len:256 (-) Transcript_1712:62-829(-)
MGGRGGSCCADRTLLMGLSGSWRAPSWHWGRAGLQLGCGSRRRCPILCRADHVLNDALLLNSLSLMLFRALGSAVLDGVARCLAEGAERRRLAAARLHLQEALSADAFPAASGAVDCWIHQETDWAVLQRLLRVGGLILLKALVAGRELALQDQTAELLQVHGAVRVQPRGAEKVVIRWTSGAAGELVPHLSCCCLAGSASASLAVERGSFVLPCLTCLGVEGRGLLGAALRSERSRGLQGLPKETRDRPLLLYR